MAILYDESALKSIGKFARKKAQDFLRRIFHFFTAEFPEVLFEKRKIPKKIQIRIPLGREKNFPYGEYALYLSFIHKKCSFVFQWGML